MRKIAIASISAAFLALALASPARAQSNSISTLAPTTNNSAVITTGGTFQQILAAVTPAQSRRSLTIQNNNTTSTDNCWLFIGAGTPTAGTSILLTPGGSYTRYWPYVPSDQIRGTCQSNGNTIYVDRQ